MTAQELQNWLATARQDVIQQLNLQANWWPMTLGNEQSRASAWALAFFIRAARDRCSAIELTAHCTGGGDRQRILDALWTSAIENRTHSPSQVLVDFSVHNWSAANPVQVTGESEVYASHGVGDSLSAADDYSWDFYKLLVIPSVTRLFLARVAGHGGQSAADRVTALGRTLRGLVDLYGPALLRPNDELGVVLIPSARNQRASTLLLWLDRGRLCAGQVTVDLLVPPAL